MAGSRRLLVLAVLTGSLLLTAPAAGAARPPAGWGKGTSYCRNHGSSINGIEYEDVYACATTRSDGYVPFDADEQDPDNSFQCVELVARFLWAIYGIWAGPGSGVNPGSGLVKVVHSNHPSIPVAYPGPGSVPLAGDVASFGPGGAVDSSVGHTGVVIWSDRASGEFKIMSENFPEGRDGIQTIYVDLSGKHDGKVKFNGISAWTTASWLVLVKATPTPTPTPTPKPTPTPVGSCDSGVTSAGYKTPCDYTVGHYEVYGTGGDGLYQHTGPGTQYAKVTSPNTLPDGSAINIACQLITASKVNGSGVWDLETNGYWVADYYVNTPDVGKYSPGLAQCVAS